MRCSYCYEWNELSSQQRMPPDTWRLLLASARDFHAMQASRFPNTITNLVFHGGEPLALPMDYLTSALQQVDEVFSNEIKDGSVRIGLQTNLYRPTQAKLDLLQARHVQLGVSVDLIPGARLSVTGQPTETDVIANLEYLRASGIPFGAISVLALHTHQHLRSMHDFFATRNIPWRVLPLFDGPDSRPLERVSLSDDRIIAALEDLFIYWFESGRQIPIDPFAEHLENVLRKMAGIIGQQYDRRDQHEGVFVVNVDGSLFRVVDGYEPHLSLGNVADQTISEILRSPAYNASLDRDDQERNQFCSHCEYRGACNGWPIHASRQPGDFHGRCPLSYRIHLFMERYLRSHGFDERRLSTMAHQVLVADLPVATSQMASS